VVADQMFVEGPTTSIFGQSALSRQRMKFATNSQIH